MQNEQDSTFTDGETASRICELAATSKTTSITMRMQNAALDIQETKADHPQRRKTPENRKKWRNRNSRIAYFKIDDPNTVRETRLRPIGFGELAYRVRLHVRKHANRTRLQVRKNRAREAKFENTPQVRNVKNENILARAKTSPGIPLVREAKSGNIPTKREVKPGNISRTRDVKAENSPACDAASDQISTARDIMSERVPKTRKFMSENTPGDTNSSPDGCPPRAKYQPREQLQCVNRKLKTKAPDVIPPASETTTIAYPIKKLAAR